jgi:Ni/Fe-hydrogenase subunit HybB-like protein
VIVLLCLFTYAMTSSIGWVIAIFILTLLFQLMQAKREARPTSNVPILLIMAGVALSCMHQSSLGSLYLIVPNKLHPLWYTPILSFLFLGSAILVGPAMVIFEGIVSAKVFKRKPETELLAELAKALPFLLIIYLLMRISDLLVRGAIVYAAEWNLVSVMFWVELAVGTAIPLLLLSNPQTARTEKGLFWGSLCIILGLFINRLNVSVIGFQAAGWETYTPALSEILISVGVVAAGLLVFRYIVKNYPVYEEEPAASAG